MDLTLVANEVSMVVATSLIATLLLVSTRVKKRMLKHSLDDMKELNKVVRQTMRELEQDDGFAVSEETEQLTRLPGRVRETRILNGIHITSPLPKKSQSKSPRSARYLLRFIIGYKDQDAMLGDLEEIYLDQLDENGPVMARIWYWWQVICSFVATIKSKLLPGGIVLALYDILRRIIS